MCQVLDDPRLARLIDNNLTNRLSSGLQHIEKNLNIRKKLKTLQPKRLIQAYEERKAAVAVLHDRTDAKMEELHSSLPPADIAPRPRKGSPSRIRGKGGSPKEGSPKASPQLTFDADFANSGQGAGSRAAPIMAEVDVFREISYEEISALCEVWRCSHDSTPSLHQPTSCPYLAPPPHNPLWVAEWACLGGLPGGRHPRHRPLHPDPRQSALQHRGRRGSPQL